MRAKSAGHPADRIDGVAPAIQALRERIRHLAGFDAVGGAMVPTLLLQGETGTGKGLVARIVHDSGPRARGPFIPVNCAAIPETMLEAELFGYEPGAFTDARRAKPGLFEAAAGGTLFLDELDSLSLGLQSKLLTAIEDKRIRRLGAVDQRGVDVKLIAATQQDLGRFAADGRFRADLYHRLAVVVLALPPLRDRGDDVVLLARTLLARFAAGYGVGAKRLTADAEAWLRRYAWPGNVRELGHAMERITLLHEGPRVDARALEQLVRTGRSQPTVSAAPSVVTDVPQAAQPDLTDVTEVDQPDATDVTEAVPPDVRDVTQTAEREPGRSTSRPEHVLPRSPVLDRPPLTLPSPRRGEGEGGQVADAAQPARDAEPGEARQLRDALARTAGNVLRAARILGVTRDTVRYRMRRYGIGRPEIDRSDSAAAPPAPVSGVAAETPAPIAATAPTESATATLPAEAPSHAGSPAWEQKPVALVAIELTWPALHEGRPPGHEPWTETARWQRTIREKLEGLGGVLLPHTPSLLVWAFGIPRALEQQQERALHGALAVQNLVAGLTARERVPELRIAVHLGAMLVDATASDPATAAMPVGETMAVPVRLLAHAEAGEVLASVEVERRLGTWVSLEPIEVGGRSSRRAPATAYRVLGVVPPRDRGIGRRRSAMTAFVGRARELETLRDLAASATGGSGLVVGVVGEAGTGKSRLLYELGRSLHDAAIRYGEAHCHAAGNAVAYLALREIVAIQLGLAESESGPVVRETVEGRLGTLGLDAARHAPYLVSLLGAADPSAPLDRDGETLKARTFEAALELFLAEAAHEPLVMTVENAHWIDPTSEEWLTALADRLTGQHLLLVVTYRPGYRPPWMDRAHATQIALRPLDPEASRLLVRGLPGVAALAPAVEADILAKAEGNPLFLEELSIAVVEQGDAGAPTVPDSVLAVLAARIDRLATDDKLLLQTAAVIGREVPTPLLREVSGLDADAFEERLARLRAAEFLFARGGRPERSHIFKHALTRVAAYESLAPSTRQLLHHRVLERLESQGGTARAEQVEELAHHAASAGEWAKAVVAWHRAGRAALARHAPREAARSLEHALTALAADPAATGGDARAVDLRSDLAQACYAAGDLVRSGEELRAALALTEKLGDASSLARVLMGMLHVHSTEGRYHAAVASGERALALADQLGSAAVKVWASIGLCRASFAAGAYRRGAEMARVAIDALRGEPETGPVGMHWLLQPAAAARSYLALCLARTGDFDEASRHAEDAMRIAERGSALDRVWAAYGLARVRHARTDFDEAIPLLERGLALAEAQVAPTFLARVLAGLGSSYTQAGRPAEAPPLLERALALSGSVHLEQGRSLILVQLGEARLALGQLDAAEALAGEALALSRERFERGNEAWALHLAGEVAARRGATQQARERLGAALECAQSLEMRPLAALCRLTLGACTLSAGATDEGRALLRAACDALQAMGIVRWHERARSLLSSAGSIDSPVTPA